MKKTILLFAGLLGVAGSIYAQAPERRYDVTFSSGNTYDALGTGATQIAFDANWEDTVSAPVNLGMDFKYQNTPISTISIESLGGLTMNSKPLDGLGHIMGIGMEYASKGRAKIAYELTGTAGNRIFKVEYKNMGRNNDATDNDTLNYQIWLHEADNAIEYRAGYNNVPDTMFAHLVSEAIGGKEVVTIGLAGNDGDSLGTDLDASFMHILKSVGGQVSDTALWISDVEGNPLFFAEYLIYGIYPAEGSVIRFVPKPGNVGVGKVDFNLATVYPNPSKNGRFNVVLKEQLNQAVLTLFDITGKVVYDQPVKMQNTTIDLSHLPMGQYIGKLQSKEKTGVFKLVKE